MCEHNIEGNCVIDPDQGRCNPATCPFADEEDERYMSGATAATPSNPSTSQPQE